MSALISIRTNIFYTKKEKSDTKKPEYEKNNELVFLIAKPSYSYSNTSELVKQTIVEEIRFSVTEVQFDKMIALLQLLKEAKENDLG